MNISSMVGQSYSARRFIGAHQKSSTMGGAQPSFTEKLQEFRKTNAVDRLFIEPSKEPPQEQSKENEFPLAACSSQLFSAWNSNISAEAALAKLDENLSKIGEFSLDSGLDPREVLQHLAAQYSVYKKHIDATGEKDQLKGLDKLMERHTLKYAHSLADAVGGFYEANGLAGERDLIYTSAVESVKNLTQIYDTYMAEPKNEFDTLLENVQRDGASLSNELRKAVRYSGITVEGRGKGEYNSFELSMAAKLARQSDKMLYLGSAAITNEEELGLQIGKVTLQALAFLETSGAKERHQEAFMDAVKNKAEQFLDEVDALLEKEAAFYREKNPTKETNPYNTLDREAVFAVVEKMAASYKKTGLISEALEAGEEYGLQQYLAKASVDSVSERYRGSAFWQREVKDAFVEVTRGNKKFYWITGLLEGKTNSWLNLIA